MQFIINLNKRLRKFEEFIISYGIIIMATVLVANVISRSLFSNSLKFAEEMGQLLIVMITFIGTSYAARLGRHITMSALFDHLPRKFKRIFMYVTSLVSAGLLFHLGILGVQYVQRVFISGRITPALQIPMWTLYCFVPLGFFLASLQYIVSLILNFQDEEYIYTGSERTLEESDINCEI